MADKDRREDQGEDKLTGDEARRSETDPGKPAVPAERKGFWGSGEHGDGFHREEHLDHSREDYGATEQTKE